MQEAAAPQAEERTVEVRAHEVAMASNIRDVVRGLVDALGATMVAAIGGVSETRAVKQWMTDRDPQRPNTLRFALQLAWIIAEKSDRSRRQSPPERRRSAALAARTIVTRYPRTADVGGTRLPPEIPTCFFSPQTSY